jgi:NNP family nitrate/nitrite transporter-like MFS transporter
MTAVHLKRKSQLFLLGLLTTIFFVNFLARIALAPLLPVIEKDLGLGHAGVGSFFMMMALGYAAGLFVSGYLSSRFTFRQTIALSAIAIGCAFFLVAASRNLWAIRIGLVLTGIPAGIYLPSGITTITASVSPANWGKAISIHELAPSLAYFAAPLIVEGLLAFFPWQGVLALIGGVSVILGLSFLRLGQGGDFSGEAPTLGNIRLLTGKPAFWIMVALFSLAIASTMGLYSMMPLYLVAERGIDRGLANTLVGLSRIPVLIVTFFSGWISDRFGPKPTIAVVILFNGLTAILLGALPGQWVILMVFLQPTLSVCFFPAGFMILSRIVPSSARNLSVSLTIFIAYLVGAGLIPTALGIFGDAGMFSLSFILVGSITFLSVLLITRLDLTEPKSH